ncbi:sodium:solute symporter [candidate division KSB1 bacterium]|nr:sodium:solute symporter [candidate division KSB1 bacterium]
MGFTTLDYGIVLLTMLGSIALGFYFARFQKSSKDYFLGSRDMPWLAISLSVVATETSTLTFIGVPALAFGGNMTFLQMTIGYLIARILVSIFFLPAYYRGEMFTAYTFIKNRFGRRTQTATASVFLLTRLLADGVRLFATAIPLAIITGFSYPVSIAIICAVTILYTYLGGLKAVIWLDAIQLIIYLVGAVLAMFIIIDHMPGGLSQLLAISGEAGKLRIFDFSFDFTATYTIFSGIIGGTFLSLASHGTDQLIVQRLLACKSVRDSQKALITSGVVVMVQFFFFLAIGVLLYAFYTHFPEKLAISKNDEVFPLFIINELPSGLSGLVIAAIFAAAMSTLSSSLNSLASSTIMDFIKPYLKPAWTESKELLYSRITTLGWAVLLIGIAILASQWGSVLESGLKIASFTYGALLGTFLLGLFSKRIGQVEVIISMFFGLLVMFYVNASGLPWPWFVAIGTTTTVVCGMGLYWVMRLRRK